MTLGRSRLRVLAATLVVGTMAVGLGCSDKKKSENDTPAKVVPPAVQGLEAIPASATQVIGVDVAALANSPIVLRALERMFASKPALRDGFRKVLGDCKLDLKSDVSSATIALIPTANGESDSLLVAKGRFEEGALVACLGKSLNSESGGRLETATLDGRSLYHQVGGEAPGLWFSFGSKETVLVSSGRPALEAALGTGAKFAKATTGVASLLSRANTSANLWAIGAIPSDVGEGLVGASGGLVKAPLAVVASADLSSGLSLGADLQLRSSEEANTLISQAKAQIAAAALVLQIDSLGRMVQKAELSADGSWATLRWAITNEELQDLMGANLSGLGASKNGSGIDNEGANDENPAPKSETERETQDGN